MIALARLAGALALLLPVALAPAHAADANVDRCSGAQKATLPEMIAACTAALPATAGKAVERAFLLQNRGQSYDQTGEVAAALKDFDEAIKLAPAARFILLSYVGRSQIYVRQRKGDVALADATEAVRLAELLAEVADVDPTFREASLALALKTRGDAYAAKSKAELALADYDRAIVLAPANAKVYAARGDLLWAKSVSTPNLSEHARALADYTKAIELKPDFANAYAQRCKARVQVPLNLHGAVDPLALPDCNDAIRLDPTPGHYYTRALLYLHLQRPGDARADCDAGLKAKPGWAPLLYARGLAKDASGDKPGGKADMDAAIKADPKIAQAFERMALYPEAHYETKPGPMSEQRKAQLKKLCEAGAASPKECKEAGW